MDFYEVKQAFLDAGMRVREELLPNGAHAIYSVETCLMFWVVSKFGDEQNIDELTIGPMKRVIIPTEMGWNRVKKELVEAMIERWDGLDPEILMPIRTHIEERVDEFGLGGGLYAPKAYLLVGHGIDTIVSIPGDIGKDSIQ